MQINTKLPLGAVFGDFKSSKQDLLVRSLIEMRIHGARGVVSYAGFNSKFTLGFHTYSVGDGDLEERVSGISISSSAGTSSLTAFSSGYRSSNLETSPS